MPITTIFGCRNTGLLPYGLTGFRVKPGMTDRMDSRLRGNDTVKGQTRRSAAHTAYAPFTLFSKSREITRRWISEVPSPISQSLTSRQMRSAG